MVILNLIQTIGVFIGAGYSILKIEEKEKIRKTMRQIIRDNHRSITALLLERYKKLAEIGNGGDEYDNYVENIQKEKINSIYNKLVEKAIDEVEKSKVELEKLKKILEDKEISKNWVDKKIESVQTNFEINAIKYAQDVYYVFDGYSIISKAAFKNKLMHLFPLPPEKFDSLYREITSKMYGIVKENYDDKSEFVINYELWKKPDEKHKEYNRLIVYYDEWKIKNNKINNEIEEELNNKKIRLKNLDNYGQIIQEIFKGTTKYNPSLSKDYFKKQLELRLNLTDVESNELCNLLLRNDTGLLENPLI